MNTIVGVFQDKFEAELAMEDFENHGHNNGLNLSLGAKNHTERDLIIGSKGGKAFSLDSLKGLSGLILEEIKSLRGHFTADTRLVVIPVKRFRDETVVLEIFYAHNAKNIRSMKQFETRRHN